MSFIRHIWLSLFLLVAATTAIAAPAAPNTPTPPNPTSPAQNATTAAAPAVFDIKAIRASLDKAKGVLDGIEKSLNNNTLTDEQLISARDQILPMIDSLQQYLLDVAPRISTVKARLDQLGPKPKEGSPEESSEVVNERAEKEATLADLTETQRLGNTILVQANQLLTEISDKRRAIFKNIVFERSNSIVSPDLWYNVLKSIPQDLSSVGALVSDWIKQVRANATLASTALFILAACLWIALFAGRPLLAGKVIKRDPSIEAPSDQRKVFAAVAVLLLRTTPAAIGAAIIYSVVKETNLIPERVEPVMGHFLLSAAVFAFLNALSDAILSPSTRSWRLISISDSSALRLRYYILLIAFVVFTGDVIDAFYQALNVARPIMIASRSIFSLVAAGILTTLLLHFAIAGKVSEENLAAYSAAESEIGGPLRMICWLMIISITGSALFGYIELSGFIVHQSIWLAMLFALLRLSFALVNQLLNPNVTTRSFIIIQANTGLTRSTLEQITVIINGILRVLLILAAIVLALNPLGIESFDYAVFMRAAFFGFQIGDITISISTTILAIGLFVIGVLIIRMLQRWLEHTYLPATNLDAGLRNSIRTGIGYVGMMIVGFATLSYAGINLSNVTIVAGALSVGVGFGLQSIVNNFVSGLILLWERPIRVGDLVVVGDGEGHVNRINVRSTEIMTSDRTSIIVPNSNLISGVVRNRVRGDRTGRITVAIPVNRGIDPDELVAIVKRCALEHLEVASVPAPNVLFKKIGESTLDFELVCFVEEIETASRVASDLHFSIFRALRDAGIIPMPSTTTIQLQGLETVAESINSLSGKRLPCRSTSETEQKKEEGDD